jgi:hypothetical protein
MDPVGRRETEYSSPTPTEPELDGTPKSWLDNLGEKLASAVRRIRYAIGELFASTRKDSDGTVIRGAVDGLIELNGRSPTDIAMGITILANALGELPPDKKAQTLSQKFGEITIFQLVLECFLSLNPAEIGEGLFRDVVAATKLVLDIANDTMPCDDLKRILGAKVGENGYSRMLRKDGRCLTLFELFALSMSPWGNSADQAGTGHRANTAEARVDHYGATRESLKAMCIKCFTQGELKLSAETILRIGALILRQQHSGAELEGADRFYLQGSKPIINMAEVEEGPLKLAIDSLNALRHWNIVPPDA